MSRCDRYLSNFGMGIGRDRYPVILPIGEDGANCLFGVGKRFLLVVSLGDYFGKGRHEDGKAASVLRFQDN